MKQGKVRVFLTGGDYSNDFTHVPVPVDEAIEDMETQMRMNPNELAILIVPEGKDMEEVLELLDNLKEAVEEGMKQKRR